MGKLWPKPEGVAQWVCRIAACALIICLLAVVGRDVEDFLSAPEVASSSGDVAVVIITSSRGFVSYLNVALVLCGIPLLYFMGWKYSRLAAFLLFPVAVITVLSRWACGCVGRIFPDEAPVELFSAAFAMLFAALVATFVNRRNQGREAVHG